MPGLARLKKNMSLLNQIFSRRDQRRTIAADRDRLYRVALSWCGDPMVADDLVQEALLIALHSIDQLRDSRCLSAWMYRILSNCWHQHLRQLRPMTDIDDASIVSDTDAESCCCEQQTVARVRAAILKLPPGQRQTLTLVDLGGFSYAEVAEALNIPIGTVMSRLHTARRSLRRLLLGICDSTPVPVARIGDLK